MRTSLFGSAVRPRGWRSIGLLGLGLVLAGAVVAPRIARSGSLRPAAGLRPAPEFPTQEPDAWIGTPVRLADLRGKVVLLDLWTFGCVNCVRTIPWVQDVAARYAGRGLQMVGVHTPEFERERDRGAVADHVRRHRLAFPQLIDNDYAYWNALENQYWPAIYIVDRCGRIRDHAIGEVHTGEPSGRRLEARIEELLAEDTACLDR